MTLLDVLLTINGGGKTVKTIRYLAIAALLVSAACDAPLPTVPEANLATTVPGHTDKYDADNNGYPDAGYYVNGHYYSVYAYDMNGDYYWDLGDGRVQGTVGSVEELDQETLTVCDYVINYRADFGNDPYMNTGWIQNIIRCSGYDDNSNYKYFIVHEQDPRYTGDPEWAVWGTWEYHGYVVSRLGNLVHHYIEP